MIIVLTNMINNIYQSDYAKITDSLCLKSIQCPFCHNNGMRIHAYYHRRIKYSFTSEKTILRILRVRCTNDDCRRTHAVLPDSIIPGSQISLEETIRIVMSEERTEDMNAILDNNCLMSPNDFYYTRRKLKRLWNIFISQLMISSAELLRLIIHIFRLQCRNILLFSVFTTSFKVLILPQGTILKA